MEISKEKHLNTEHIDVQIKNLEDKEHQNEQMGYQKLRNNRNEINK